MQKSKQKPKMLNFRVSRNLATRLKRAAAVQGISQTAIVIQALEREIMRWEKEYTETMRIRKKIETEMGLHEIPNSDG